MASHLCLGIHGGLETLPYTPSNWRRVLFLPYQGLKGCMRPLGPPTDDTSLLTAAIRCQQVLKSWSSTTVQRRNGWHLLIFLIVIPALDGMPGREMGSLSTSRVRGQTEASSGSALATASPRKLPRS